MYKRRKVQECLWYSVNLYLLITAADIIETFIIRCSDLCHLGQSECEVLAPLSQSLLYEKHRRHSYYMLVVSCVKQRPLQNLGAGHELTAGSVAKHTKHALVGISCPLVTKSFRLNGKEHRTRCMVFTVTVAGRGCPAGVLSFYKRVSHTPEYNASSRNCSRSWCVDFQGHLDNWRRCLGVRRRGGNQFFP